MRHRKHHNKLQFSPDGKTLAYNAKIDSKWYVIAGKEKAGPYDDVIEFKFSSDGKTLAYTAQINYLWYIIAGNEKVGPYNYVSRLQFSPDGNTLGYRVAIKDGADTKILINGKEYTGSIVNGVVIYIDNGTIYIK